jgi:hypothetical protein
MHPGLAKNKANKTLKQKSANLDSCMDVPNVMTHLLDVVTYWNKTTCPELERLVKKFIDPGLLQ